MLGKQAKILTERQQEIFLKYLADTQQPERNTLIALLSFKAGLRAKEIASLTWDMVCDSEGFLSDIIRLPNNATKGSSGRIIPINKKLKEAFVILAQKESVLKGAVIKTNRAKKTTAQVIVNFFYHHFKIVGFENCSSHSGRRTFITKAAKQINNVGGSLNDVRMIAGHSSLQTTQRYIEYDTEAQKKIVELL